MKQLFIYLDDDSIHHSNTHVFISIIDSLKYFQKMDTFYKDFTIHTANLYMLENQAQIYFDKIFFCTYDHSKNKVVESEVWPDDHLWNNNNKEIKPTHNLRKLLMPYINSFTYTEKEALKRNYNLAKDLSSNNRSCTFFDKDGKIHFFKNGQEVSKKEFSQTT